MGICEAFLMRGAKVFTCGRKEERVEEAREKFRDLSEGFHAIRCNVTSVAELKGLFEALEEKAGRLDILVNNVGMNRFTPFILDAEPELWDKILEGNLKAHFLVTKMALDLLKRSEGAKIVNMSSIAGQRAAPGMGIYCIAKAGLDMLTKVLASELAHLRINVNGVAPGVVKTDFSRPLWMEKEGLKELEGRVPAGRIAEVKDVIGAVLFLASTLSDYITGHTLVVDGGWLTY
jgi:2-deoxy-D-gluconate 3-dehydrogenase